MPTPLVRAGVLPRFGGAREAVFLVPGAGLEAGQIFYARIDAQGTQPRRVYFGAGTLTEALARGVRHALMISLACGALTALALATAAMWLVLSDELFILYAGMTGLQASIWSASRRSFARSRRSSVSRTSSGAMAARSSWWH